MANSGIKVDEEVEKLCEEVKTGKVKCFCIEISKDKKRAVVKEGTVVRRANKNEKAAKPVWEMYDFDDDKPMWVVNNCEIDEGDGSDTDDENDGHHDLPVLLNWTPDNCPVKQRMLMASTNDTVKSKVTGKVGAMGIVKMASKDEVNSKHCYDNIQKSKVDKDGRLKKFEGMKRRDIKKR